MTSEVRPSPAVFRFCHLVQDELQERGGVTRSYAIAVAAGERVEIWAEIQGEVGAALCATWAVSWWSIDHQELPLAFQAKQAADEIIRKFDAHREALGLKR